MGWLNLLLLVLVILFSGQGSWQPSRVTLGDGAMKSSNFLQAQGSQVIPRLQRRQVPLWCSASDKQKRWFPQSSIERHLSTSEQLLACGSSGTAVFISFPCTLEHHRYQAVSLQWSHWKCYKLVLCPDLHLSGPLVSPDSSPLAWQVCFHLLPSSIFSSTTDTIKHSHAQTATWRSCSNISHSLVIDFTHSFCALSCFNSLHTSTWPEITKTKVTLYSSNLWFFLGWLRPVTWLDQGANFMCFV